MSDTPHQWPRAWKPARDNKSLAIELTKEVGPKHVLRGRKAVALGYREDTDDVLFLLDGDADPLYALVHLTWSRSEEENPDFPTTRLFNTWEEFIERARKLAPPLTQVLIDGAGTPLEGDFYRELQRVLGIVDWFGYNLDALIDVLQDDELRKTKDPCEVVWKNSDIARKTLTTFDKIVEVFDDSPVQLTLE